MKIGVKKMILLLVIVGVTRADWCVNHEVVVVDQLMSHYEAMSFCNAQGKMLLFPENIDQEW